MYYTKFDTPLCPITLIGDEKGLKRLYMHTKEAKYPLALADTWQETPDFFDSIKEQLLSYLAGDLRTFDVKLAPEGTAFQTHTWNALTAIPYGETRTYGQQALTCNCPTAMRAIGGANGKNPIPIIIPCHRVVGSKGQLTGFAFGTSIKQQLIALEQKAVG